MGIVRVASLCGVGVALVAFGCGDDSGTGTGGGGTGGGPTTTGTGGTTTSTGGSGTGGGGTQFSAVVFGGPGGGVTLEGAGVALDLDDGSRVEGVSHAMGEVSLTIPAGKAWTSVIGHKAGFNFVFVPKALNFQEPIQLGLAPDGSDKTGLVKLSGTATNMVSPTADIFSALVKTGTEEFVFEQPGVSAYELFMRSGEDFTLTFLDGTIDIAGQSFSRTFNSYVTSQETAITADTVIDVDFSTGIAPSGSFTTSVKKPADATLAANGWMLMNVVSDNGFVGGSTACPHDGANGEFDCTGSIFDNGATASTTIYLSTDKSDITAAGRGVNAIVIGGPPSGLADPQFPNPPTVTAPSGAGPFPVDTAMAYSTAAGGGAFDFTLYQLVDPTPGGRVLGFGFLPPGTFTVPDLPSTSDPAIHFEASMRVGLFNCRVSQGQCVAVGFQEWDATPPN
jgi:hypothetical protein